MTPATTTTTTMTTTASEQQPPFTLSELEYVIAKPFIEKLRKIDDKSATREFQRNQMIRKKYPKKIIAYVFNEEWHNEENLTQDEIDIVARKIIDGLVVGTNSGLLGYTTTDELRDFLRVHPGAAKAENYHGAIALHSCSDLEVAKVLLDAWPDSVKARRHRKDDSIPLHTCYSLEIAELFVKMWPDSVKTKRRDGSYPLHCACMAGRSVGLIEFLVSQWPEAATIPTSSGDYPLHALCGRGGCDIQKVKALVESSPECIKCVDSISYLPLHAACEGNAKFELVEYLLNTYPDAVRKMSTYGDLPIHLAVGQKVSTIIRLLVDTYPESVRITGEYERLPLHIACQESFCDTDSSDVVPFLVSKFPESVKIRNQVQLKKKKVVMLLPLHSACMNRADTETIKCLVDVWPESAMANVSSTGNLPLHLVCSKNYADPVLVKYLVDVAPESVKVKNNDGCLPLHLACRRCNRQDDIRKVKYLVSAYPESVKIKDTEPTNIDVLTSGHGQDTRQLLDQLVSPWLSKNVGELPLHIACRTRATEEVITFLLGMWPDAVRVRGNNGNLPLHEYVHPEALSSRYGEQPKELNILKLLVGLYPESIMVFGEKDRFLPFHNSMRDTETESVCTYLLCQLYSFCKVHPMEESRVRAESLKLDIDLHSAGANMYQKLREDGMSDANLRQKMKNDHAYSMEYYKLVGESEEFSMLMKQLLMGKLHDGNGLSQLLTVLDFQGGLDPNNRACQSSDFGGPAPMKVMECLRKAMGIQDSDNIDAEGEKNDNSNNAGCGSVGSQSDFVPKSGSGEQHADGDDIESAQVHDKESDNQATKSDDALLVAAPSVSATVDVAGKEPKDETLNRPQQISIPELVNDVMLSIICLSHQAGMHISDGRSISGDSPDKRSQEEVKIASSFCLCVDQFLDFIEKQKFGKEQSVVDPQFEVILHQRLHSIPPIVTKLCAKNQARLNSRSIV